MFTLEQIYERKICPYIKSNCIGANCAKFTTCIGDEVDALFAIGISQEDYDILGNEIIKMVTE
jgi:hypothetical protein